MKTQSLDTQPEVEAIQISLIRKSTLAKRFSIVRSLSSSVIQLSRRAIKRANPTFSDSEVNLEFIRLHYGADLFRRTRDYLKKKENG